MPSRPKHKKSRKNLPGRQSRSQRRQVAAPKPVVTTAAVETPSAPVAAAAAPKKTKEPKLTMVEAARIRYSFMAGDLVRIGWLSALMLALLAVVFILVS